MTNGPVGRPRGRSCLVWSAARHTSGARPERQSSGMPGAHVRAAAFVPRALPVWRAGERLSPGLVAAAGFAGRGVWRRPSSDGYAFARPRRGCGEMPAWRNWQRTCLVNKGLRVRVPPPARLRSDSHCASDLRECGGGRALSSPIGSPISVLSGSCCRDAAGSAFEVPRIVSAIRSAAAWLTPRETWV